MEFAAPPLGADDGFRAKPLLINLDQALIRNSLLAETALAYIAANPVRMIRLVVWMMRGNAYLEKRLAETPGADPELIPVNVEIAEVAREAKLQGREVYLTSASDEAFAFKFAQRFGVFDGVIAYGTDSTQRAAVLNARFPDGYDYVEGRAADLPIGIETDIPHKSRVRALIEAARLHHWVKNTLIFVPAVLSGTIIDPYIVAASVAAFVALGLVAVGTYLVNDLIDIEHDRRHWSKRSRPIAAGDVPISTAIGVAAVTILSGLAIGAALGLGVFATIMAYLVLTLAYSFHLKRIPIVDVTVLAILFTLRIAVGIAAAGVFASPWLLVFSMALFASLSIAKRYTEIQRTAIKGETDVPGRGYITADAPLVLGLGLATATTSVVILVLFLIFDAFGRDVYRDPQWLWVLPVIIFLWIGRIWLICQRGELNDDPVVFALKDRQSLVLGTLCALAFGLALFGVPL